MARSGRSAAGAAARFGRAAIGIGLAGVVVAWPEGRAGADPLPLSAEHVDSPARNVTSDDTGDAIVLNPANLAFLPAPELRWTWLHCSDTTAKVGCGHAWEASAPLPFGFATGLRFDLVQPPWGRSEADGVTLPFRGSDFDWLTWALALRLGERASLGFSIQHAYSANPFINGLNGVSAGLSWRPNSHFAFAGVAHDFNRPAPGIFPAIPGTSAINPAPVLDGRYTLGMSFRPTGRRDFDLGLELDYRQGQGSTDVWTQRATLGVDIPMLGRALAGVEAVSIQNPSHSGVVGTLGLEAHFRGLGLGGGALFGDGLGGGDGSVAEFVTASIAGYTQPGIPNPEHVVWMRIEKTPSVREHVALLRRLWGLAKDRDVVGVTLVLRDEPASSFAHAEELADAIRVLRAHHKKVLCSWEVAGPKALYACASADRIVLHPSGGIDYAGLKSQYIYLRGLLDKIGVKADFVRVGPHKTAPEQFTNEHAGPVANQDHIDFLRQQEAVFVRNLAVYRHMSEERVREVTRKGPFFGPEAREAGFVDGFTYDDELPASSKEMMGRDVEYTEYADVTRAPQTFGARPKVALLYLDGSIVDGRSKHIPLVDMSLVGSYSMQDTIRSLRDDPMIRAVVLRIESPGGSSLASDVMWRELYLLQKKKPLIVSMGAVAASGGYYVASVSRNIYAEPLTITGSIGVFYGKADVSGLLSKIGVTVDTYKSAPRADAESMFRGFTADETRELEHKVDQFYQVFLGRVSEGRGMRRDEVDALGRGRVWTGQQAFDRHLVDHLGGLREALDAARAAGGLPSDAPIVEAPEENETILQKVLSAAGGADVETPVTIASLPPAVQGLARSLAPLLVYRDDEPLARMEWVEDE
jgi:protease-4